jgi:hypothetical protein
MPSHFVRHFSAVTLLVAFALLLTLIAPALGQVRSPPPPPPAAKKPVGSPPPPPPSATAKKPAAWGNKADATPDNDGVRRLAPIADHDTKLIFAPAPSAMVAVNNGEVDGIVFDCAAGKEVGKIPPGLKDSDLKFALSPTGRYFARTSKVKYHNFIEVVDTATGEVKHSLEFAEGDFQRVTALQFTKHDHLLAAVQQKPSGGKVILWRMDTGKVLKEMDTKRLDEDKFAASDTGQYLAAVTDSRLQVIDFTKGKAVAEMEMPAKSTGITSPSIFIRALAFSPDTSELAGIITGQNAEHHLVVWSADGKIADHLNLGLTIRSGYHLDGPLQWTADGQGWLLHGNYFVDRQLKAVAWVYESPVQHNYAHKLLGNEHLVATQGDFTTRQLVSIEIPRQRISIAAESLTSGAAALLKPGDTVELRVDVGSVRFSNPGGAISEIEKNVAQRLKDGGLTVGAGGKAVLHVKYTEAQGEELRVVEGGFGIFGRDTGQRVQETVAILEAKLTSGGKTIWEETAKRGNPHHIEGGIVNDAAVRDATFRMIGFMLRTLQIPYFVPADENATSLPIRVSLER